MSFFKNKGKQKWVLSGARYQWEGIGYREGIKEGEYGRNIMYSCMKIEKLDLLKLF
jgi:hypothetical protein